MRKKTERRKNGPGVFKPCFMALKVKIRVMGLDLSSRMSNNTEL